MKKERENMPKSESTSVALLKGIEPTITTHHALKLIEPYIDIKTNC